MHLHTLFGITTAFFLAAGAAADNAPLEARDRVVWSTSGRNSRGRVQIGNGSGGRRTWRTKTYVNSQGQRITTGSSIGSKTSAKDAAPLDFTKEYPQLSKEASEECKRSWNEATGIPCSEYIFNRSWDTSKWHPTYLLHVPTGIMRICKPSCAATLDKVSASLNAACSGPNDVFDKSAPYHGRFDIEKLDPSPASVVDLLDRRNKHLCRVNERTGTTCTEELSREYAVMDGLEVNADEHGFENETKRYFGHDSMQCSSCVKDYLKRMISAATTRQRRNTLLQSARRCMGWQSVEVTLESFTPQHTFMRQSANTRPPRRLQAQT